MRLIRAETGNYVQVPGTMDNLVDGDNVIGNVPGFSVGDLDGRFFGDEDYVVTTVNATGFKITATGNTSIPEVSGIVVQVDHNGIIGTDY